MNLLFERGTEEHKTRRAPPVGVGRVPPPVYIYRRCTSLSLNPYLKT